MPSSVRPKGSGSGSRAPPVTPMSERQQMALLMQMTSSGNEVGSRSPSSSSSRSRDRNERGWTPLHEACNHGWYEVAFRLVQSGANVNAKGLDNDTPLHDAAINGHLKLVKLLVERGADIHAKNSKGKTPLDVAPAAVKPYLLNTNLPLPESTVSTRQQPRSRDDKKATDAKQKGTQDETMDAKGPAAAAAAVDDVYEFKSVKDADSSPDVKGGDAPQTDADAADPLSVAAPQAEENKRGFAELADPLDDGANDEESRRKKRKDETAKEGKSTALRGTGLTKGQSGKQSGGNQNKSGASGSSKNSGDKKSPCSSPKPAVSDAEVEDGKTDLKVPPLKIVIPQTTSNEQDSGVGRNGKNSSQRTHQALPYVVPSSNSNESSDKDGTAGNASPENSASLKGDDKKESSSGGTTDERGGSSHQRVLRSSHRTGTTQGTDRGSNNSSPQLQRSHSPSPSASPSAQPPNQADPPTSSAAQANAASKSSDAQVPPSNESEASTSAPPSVTVNPAPAPVELHPRKRKMKQSREQAAAPAEPQEMPAISHMHLNEQTTTNCYQLYLNIRRQISNRRRGLFPVQPKPPQGFKDYLMNRCTYILAGTAPTTPNITYPPNLPASMKDLFTEQEKERYRLRTRHVIEKEKLVLSVEQEILRVHGRAARELANQSLPFSVCTILRDEDVYNFISPEQEEKDRNARSRYNGRLFLSWLQDVDDKWEKIKENMLLRHHHEAESLYSVQKMDWEWKMLECNLCDGKTSPKIEEAHVPMVHVSDDFDLLPA